MDETAESLGAGSDWRERAGEGGPDWLCVDLDGTLVDSDLLLESLLALIKRNPLNLFRAGIWLLRGRAYCKAMVAARVELDVASLPYNQPLVAALREQKARGRKLCLATASTAKLAQQVADHLQLFDEVIASDVINLAGSAKADALCRRFGGGRFDYIGNGAVDVPVWRCARRAWRVDTGARRRTTASGRAAALPLPRARRSPIHSWLRALRLHQWLKNLLVAVPPLVAHRLDAQTLAPVALGILAFGLCASSVYLLNDLLDLQDDRRHQRKRLRPFASGQLPLLHGLLAAPLLLGAAFALALLLSLQFAGVLLLYYVCTLAYSLRLKRVALVDVYALAGLYTLRLIAGAVVAGVGVSFWLLALSMFAFLSLALLKRYAEQIGQIRAGVEQTAGRGYSSADLQVLAALGVASGCASALVLALYVHSDEVRLLYSQPEYIWLACPLLLYWMSRAWLLAHRDQMHDDPVVFAATDRTSQTVVLLTVGAALLAI